MAASDILFADVKDLLFRDVRNLSKPSGRTGRAKEAAKWLAGLDESAPEKTAHDLTERLADALAREHDIDKRLSLLLGFEEACEKILPALEQTTMTAPLPLAATAQQAAIAADSLLKATGAAYGKLAEGMTMPDRADNAAQAALHAIRVLCRRQLLAYRASATPSAAAWKTMHDLYAVARRNELAATADEDSSLEQEYVATLLLALADPVRMQRESIPSVHTYIAALASHVKLEESYGYKVPADASSLFLLAPGRGRSGHGMSPIPPGQALAPAALVLSCGELVAAIDRLLEDASAEPPLPADTLRLLRDAWSGAAAVAAAGRDLPRADLVIGFKDTLGLIKAIAAGQRKTNPQAPEGRWTIVHETPDSFNIRHDNTAAPRLEIGDLVVLLPREHENQTCISLVRRVAPGAEHVELGLQQLTAHAVAVNLPSEDITAFGQQALVMPRLPGFGNAAGVIATPGAVKAHTIITDTSEGTAKRYKIGSRVATSAGIEFHLLQAA